MSPRVECPAGDASGRTGLDHHLVLGRLGVAELQALFLAGFEEGGQLIRAEIVQAELLALHP